MFIFPSDRPDKRFKAVFHGKKKPVYFGHPGATTYTDGADDRTKRNYIARHSKLNEDWTNPYAAGTLSRFILWEYDNIWHAINSYKKRFTLR